MGLVAPPATGITVANGFSMNTPVLLAAGPNTIDAAIGDLNNDGRPDVVAANAQSSGGSSISVILGAGDGSFNGPINTPMPASPAQVVLGDLNGDGKLDAAVASYCGLGISVLLCLRLTFRLAVVPPLWPWPI